MTTATMVSNRTMETVVQPRSSLEELVDQLMGALNFGDGDGTVDRSAARTIHEARRLRQAGDIEGGLATLADIDMAKAEAREARWAFTEWKQLVKRRFGGGVLVYSQGVGRAAALVPDGAGTLKVVAVLALRWRPGKVVSGRSLRGLRPLTGGA